MLFHYASKGAAVKAAEKRLSVNGKLKIEY